jgi:trigger factor
LRRGDDAVNEAVERIASQQNAFAPHAESHKAKTGDVVVMDFAGKIDGVAFDGGTGEGMKIEIGSGGLIPGFEDQLVGLKTGDEKVVEVTFPEDYNVESLKGKPATFDIKVTAILDKSKPQADDEFAKSLGLEGIDQLRELMKGQIEQEHQRPDPHLYEAEIAGSAGRKVMTSTFRRRWSKPNSARSGPSLSMKRLMRKTRKPP